MFMDGIKMIDSIEVQTVNDNIVLITIQLQNVESTISEEKIARFAKEIDLAMLKLYAIKVEDRTLTVKATSPLDLAPTWDMANTLLMIVKKELVKPELDNGQISIF
jgi:hypothetical protein